MRASIDLGRRWNGSHSIQKVEVEERWGVSQNYKYIKWGGLREGFFVK
jgi:hypothetical protein